MRLEKKRVLITGASRGIGKVIAEMFVKEGALVVISARSKDELFSVQDELGGEQSGVFAVTADMSCREDVKKLIEFSEKCLGGIDVLVNNAGLPMYGFAIDDPSDQAEKRFNAVIDTNFKGYWYAARFIMPLMKRQGAGSIINMSSVRGHLGLANESVYCGVKGAIGMFTKALAVEAAPYGIRVNCISPGAIQVEAIGHWVRSRYSKEVQQEYSKRFKDVHLKGMLLNQPMNRIGRSEDVGYAALYLASDESLFVTGADIAVDGGLTSLLAEPPALDLAGLSDFYKQSKEMCAWLSEQEEK